MTKSRLVKVRALFYVFTTCYEMRVYQNFDTFSELDNRRQSRNARLIKNAKFRYQATLEELSYDATRGMDKAKVINLATCDYIKKGIPVLITGPAGTVKSWLGTALG
jgi:DNA replication protein DnaC